MVVYCKQATMYLSVWLFSVNKLSVYMAVYCKQATLYLSVWLFTVSKLSVYMAVYCKQLLNNGNFHGRKLS